MQETETTLTAVPSIVCGRVKATKAPTAFRAELKPGHRPETLAFRAPSKAPTAFRAELKPGPRPEKTLAFRAP
jgi:metal-dependent amidase/aminoacylase/carboxypeptidase family protein